MSAKARSSSTPIPTPTTHEEKLLRKAGEIICRARSTEELKRFVGAFREGIDAGRGAATFAPAQLSFERRHRPDEGRRERKPAQSSGGLRHVAEILAADPLITEARRCATVPDRGDV